MQNDSLTKRLTDLRERCHAQTVELYQAGRTGDKARLAAAQSELVTIWREWTELLKRLSDLESATYNVGAVLAIQEDDDSESRLSNFAGWPGSVRHDLLERDTGEQ